MKKQIITLVVSGIALILIAVDAAHSFVLAANNCQEPNPNTIECYRPDDRISSCATLSYIFCQKDSTAELSAVYEIKNFPNGTVSSDVWLTREEGANCWRKAKCQWKGDKDTGSCEQSDVWTPWYQKSKTVINTDDCCPL